jgi:uncharacterized caspase-like protein
MDANYYGLIIGINQYADPQLESLQYAEKDASDLYNILTNSEVGMFPRANVDLLLGNDAIVNDIQQLLVEKVVDRNQNDTVLIYFAGHAISVGEKIYLVPSDLSEAQIEKNKLKYISMSLDSLRENVFRESEAKNIIFILDTCYSGSMLPKERGHRSNWDFQDQILSAFPIMAPVGNQGQMRTIFVSSEPSSPSVEYQDLENGLFTHHILAGLQKGAVDKKTGEVTVDSLLDYVKKNMPEEQKPGQYDHGYGRVVLVRHVKEVFDRDVIKYFSVAEIALQRRFTYNDVLNITTTFCAECV